MVIEATRDAPPALDTEPPQHGVSPGTAHSQTDSPVIEGLLRALQLLVQSGEVSWSGAEEPESTPDTRLREVARLALSLSALPQINGDSAAVVIDGHIPAQSARRRGRVTIVKRRRAHRHAPAAFQARVARRRPRATVRPSARNGYLRPGLLLAGMFIFAAALITALFDTGQPLSAEGLNSRTHSTAVVSILDDGALHMLDEIASYVSICSPLAGSRAASCGAAR